MKWLRRILFSLPLLFFAAATGVAFYFTNRALYPEWKTTPGECPERRRDWGKDCGDASRNGEYFVRDINLSSAGPLALDTPAWFLSAADNRERLTLATDGAFHPAGRWAAAFIHGGGADRREGYRYARYFLSRGIDYYMLDTVCHGSAPCAENKALSFGAREQQAVRNLYAAVRPKYDGLILMGTSVGATSLLDALPDLPKVNAVIAENPMFSPEQFFLDTPAAPSFFPKVYRRLLFSLAAWRADFPTDMSPAARLLHYSGAPIYFLHSTEDRLIPPHHSEDLYAEYKGTKLLWITNKGQHARLWNADPADYERRLDDFLNRHALR
ncbi:MAG: alpha/beta hydrolase [Leptospirales bacterium]|nr:alpha/beta hydrolase [Leptospirales bacterium]